jgi:hypothetical protein
MGGRRNVRAAAAAAVVAMACGCGSGALDYGDGGDGGDGDTRVLSGTLSPTDTPSPAPRPDQAAEPEPAEEYGWGLPTGPRTPDDTFEDDVYAPLATADCGGAAAELDRLWDLLDSPRTVLLYQAAVDSCRGQRHAARAWMARAGEHGWAGLDHVFSGGFRYDCEVFRSVVSVLDQRPREGVPCPGGTPPRWPFPDDLTTRDDPRTAEDEASPEPPLDGGTGTPTDAPTDAPTGAVTNTPASTADPSATP